MRASAVTTCRFRRSQAAKHCRGSRRAVISQARIIQGEERTDRAVPSQGPSKRRLSRQCRRQLPCTQPGELRASASAAYEHRGNGKRGTGKELLPMQRSHAHPSCVSRSARWASSSQSLSPTSNEYTLAHSVAGALHCHGGRCRDGPTDSLLPGVRCQTRQLGAQGFWFLFFSFLLPSRRAHAACKRRRTPRVCCGDRAHVHAHDEQRPQPRSPTLPPMVRWLGEKASPVGKHLLDDQPPHRMMLL